MIRYGALAVGVWLTFCGPANACSVSGVNLMPSHVSLAVEVSDASFSGRVVNIEVIEEGWQKVEFAVDASWKGSFSERVSIVYPHGLLAICGHQLVAQQSYVIFAHIRPEPNALNVATTNSEREDPLSARPLIVREAIPNTGWSGQLLLNGLPVPVGGFGFDSVMSELSRLVQ
jgi:hypothetical protein